MSGKRGFQTEEAGSLGSKARTYLCEEQQEADVAREGGARWREWVGNRTEK